MTYNILTKSKSWILDNDVPTTRLNLKIVCFINEENSYAIYSRNSEQRNLSKYFSREVLNFINKIKILYTNTTTTRPCYRDWMNSTDTRYRVENAVFHASLQGINFEYGFHRNYLKKKKTIKFWINDYKWEERRKQ